MLAGKLSALSLRLLCAFTLVAALSWAFGSYLVAALLPLYRSELALIMPDFRVTELTMQRKSSDTSILLRVAAKTATIRGGQVIPAGTQASASTLAGHALIYPLIVYTAIIGWPALPWRRRLVASCVAMLGIVALESLDIPWVLVGALEDAAASQLSGGNAPIPFSARWWVFLDSGGRLLFALMLAFGCVRVALAQRSSLG